LSHVPTIWRHFTVGSTHVATVRTHRHWSRANVSTSGGHLRLPGDIGSVRCHGWRAADVRAARCHLATSSTDVCTVRAHSWACRVRSEASHGPTAGGRLTIVCAFGGSAQPGCCYSPESIPLLALFDLNCRQFAFNAFREQGVRSVALGLTLGRCSLDVLS
jgi:hypothetical protein